MNRVEHMENAAMDRGCGSALFMLRELLRGQGPASAEELARHMRRPPAVVQAMLEHWRRRGRVLALPAASGDSGDSGGACAGSGCGACGGCGARLADSPQRYAWQDQPRFAIGNARRHPAAAPGSHAPT